MTDVQVGNARRWGFTALAIVAFWVLAWRAYWIGAGSSLEWLGFGHGRDGLINDYRHAIIGLTFAAVPTALLMLSTRVLLLWFRTPFSISCGLLIAICASFTCWLGEEDSYRRRPVIPLNSDGSIAEPWLHSYQLRPHQISWLWLLLPITLTTAFVIFGAWQRAVRDAKVVANGEDDPC